jgi:hypothetical protein
MRCAPILHRVPRALVAAFAATALAAVVRASPSVNGSRDDARARLAAEKVASILRDGARAADARTTSTPAPLDASAGAAPDPRSDAASTARELAGLGLDGLDALFDALVARSPGTDRDARADIAGEKRATPGAARVDAVSFEREALLAALCTLPYAAVRAHMEPLVARAASSAVRCAVLDVLGRAGSAADVELCIVAARPARTAQDDGPRDARVGLALELALCDLVLRDRGAFGPIGVLLHGLDDDTAFAVVRAVSDTRSREGLVFLARELDREPRFAACLMSEIGRMAVHAARPVDPDVLGIVRSRVSDPDSSVLDQAIIAAGRLDEFESIPALIDYLKDHRAGVRAEALWSLQHMTLLKLACEPEMWARWYEEDSAWWRDDSADVLRELHSGKTDRAASALVAIAPIRTFRHKLALEIAPLLAEPNVEIATVAANILGQLRSQAAVPALARSLDRTEGDLRRASLRALKAITAQSLPAESSAWLALVPSR